MERSLPQLLLNQGEDLFPDQRRHRDFDPLQPRSLRVGTLSTGDSVMST
jgi:hypothetical protein